MSLILTNPKHACSDESNPPHQSLARGDLVILNEANFHTRAVVLEKDGKFGTRHGIFEHDKLVGSSFGDRLTIKEQPSRKKRKTTDLDGYIVPLWPTAELWSKSIDKRTQIIYDIDQSVVVLKMGLKPGDIVIESGTGAMTTALARCVAPSGHVHTFEFNEARTNDAREDFKRNGLDHLVTIKHRDVCETGFEDTPEIIADSIFLDLPSPWKAIPHCLAHLKENGVIVSFSPCMEQTQKTCEVLTEHEFAEIETIECFSIVHDVRQIPLELWSTTALGDEKKSKTGPNQGYMGSSGGLSYKWVSRGGAASSTRGHTAYLTFARRTLSQERDQE